MAAELFHRHDSSLKHVDSETKFIHMEGVSKSSARRVHMIENTPAVKTQSEPSLTGPTMA